MGSIWDCPACRKSHPLIARFRELDQAIKSCGAVLLSEFPILAFDLWSAAGVLRVDSSTGSFPVAISAMNDLR